MPDDFWGTVAGGAGDESEYGGVKVPVGWGTTTRADMDYTGPRPVRGVDARGVEYYDLPPMSDGGGGVRAWVGPTAGAEKPRGSLTSKYIFNRQTGQYDKVRDWNKLLNLTAGGLLAAPFAATVVAPALGIGGGGGGFTAINEAGLPYLAGPGGAPVAGAGLIAPAAGGATAPTLASTTSGFTGNPWADQAALQSVRGGARGLGSRLLSGIGGWGGVAGLGLDAVGSYMRSRAANDAARIQADYANRALDMEQRRYDDAKANFDPYLKAGQNTLPMLNDILSTRRTYGPQLEDLARGGYRPQVS